MLNKNFFRINECLRSLQYKQRLLISHQLFRDMKRNVHPNVQSQKTIQEQQGIIKHLHISNNSNKIDCRAFSHSKQLSTTRYAFSTQPSQAKKDYNSFEVIRELNSLSQNVNKLHSSSQPSTFLSKEYPTITLDLQKKLQRIELILNSPEKNLYKIVEQTIIVLESFAQTMRRDVMEENVVKVIRQFGAKIVSVFLQNLQSQEFEGAQRRKSQRKADNQTQTNTEETDSSYLLHQNYTSPMFDSEVKDLSEQFGPSNKIDANFIFFYIETIKTWLLTRIQTDALVRQAEQQMFSIFSSRQLVELGDSLKSTLQLFVRQYIEEPSIKKRELFPFDMKLRGLCLLPYFSNKQHVQKYLERLADENLFIYLKESQMINVLYDVTEIQPDLTNLTQFVYQVQSTSVYQNLTTMNAAYIKALFINYSRNFMVSYQQIQFHELFKDIEPRIRYPTIRTFIRLIHVLKTQAGDLHCEYNKVMNKYNYNIIISIISSQTYTVENTRFDELFELFQTLNSLESSGEILYDEVGKFLRQYAFREGHPLTQVELQRIYKLFEHVLDQVKPLFKYEQKQGLNKESSKKTTILLNILFDILLEKYPHVVLTGSKYIKNYMLADDTAGSPSFTALQYDDREINIEVGASSAVQTKFNRVKTAFAKVIQTTGHVSMVKDKSQVSGLLDAMLLFLKSNVHLIKNEQQSAHPLSRLPENLKLLLHLYPSSSTSVDESIYSNITIQPLLKEFAEMISKQQPNKLSINQFKQVHRTLFKVFECINLLNLNSKMSQQLTNYVELITKSLLNEVKSRVDQREIEQEQKRAIDMQVLAMSVPKGNIEILLCLSEALKLSQKINHHNKLNKENHLSSSSLPSETVNILVPHLPLIYTFINTIAIKNIKSIEQPDLIPMLLFIKSLQQSKSSQKETVLLLQMNKLVYEYLYSSLSTFVLFLADRGKYFLKLSNANAEALISIIEHFVANRAMFRSASSKKRLVVLQVVLVGLIRKKHFKITSSHLKRSQHAKILLSFLQIFEYPENLTVDLKKLMEEVQFLTSDLEQFSTDVLERYSDMNWTITRYLQDNKVGLASSKKLSKLTTEQLKKEFQESRSSKIYEMILRNSRYQLPFLLPEPKTDDQNSKLAYIIERIYHKIAVKNNYSVHKIYHKSISTTNGSTKKTRKSPILEETKEKQTSNVNEKNQTEKREDEPIEEQDKYPYETLPFQRFLQVKLQEEKSYIKRESLVNYIYEDQYKMSSNKLPLHFKKETWKSLLSIPKELQIESLQIDQKIDENIYKQVLLALLGYVEKVKIVAKEFHSHSFIQYVAAQLDMEVFFHGCIAKISRKNKPEDNVLFVCAVETNYKLLYICTHILRESGENAFIIPDKTKQTQFKEFLEKLLPQSFEPQESDIVDKVIKEQISLDAEDSGILREDV